MLEDDSYEKLARIRRVLRAVGAKGQVAVLIWVVEIGLFEKGLLSRDLREAREGAIWLCGGENIKTERDKSGTVV